MSNTPAERGFEVLSFDCYGTLIDWETGILAAVLPLLRRHGVVAPTDAILAAYGRAESAVEAGAYLPYVEVLRRTLQGMAADLGFAPKAGELDTLLDSVPAWPVFGDTVAALRRLAKHHRLAIISNVDEVLFALTAEHLEVPFDHVVTAEHVRAYKPDPVVFRKALDIIGVAPDKLLHVAQSRFHDHVPALGLGLSTVWVTRDRGRGEGAVPSTAASEGASPTWTVPNMAALADSMGV